MSSVIRGGAHSSFAVRGEPIHRDISREIPHKVSRGPARVHFRDADRTEWRARATRHAIVSVCMRSAAKSDPAPNAPAVRAHNLFIRRCVSSVSVDAMGASTTSPPPVASCSSV
jgi:hypothetical protein